jgi:hypothetical protein
MITVLWAKSLTMTKKFTFAVLASVMLAACQKETTPPQPEIITEESMPTVKIENGHLAFESRADFDRLFELPQKTRAAFIKSYESSSEFTSLREKENSTNVSNQRIINGCDVPDSLIEDNEDFFATLDRDGVIQIGNDLLRLDYCNSKVFVISTSVS